MKAKDKKFIIKVPANARVKVYLPVKKTKTRKARVRGFWRADSGRVYYDYIRAVVVDKQSLRQLRKNKGQEALFYTYEGKGYIYSGGVATCKPVCNRAVFIKGVVDFGILKAQFKKMLKQYGGFTVFDNGACYIVYAWQ